eukprot:2081218-Pleurochrysis_carterae.AAC.2
MLSDDDQVNERCSWQMKVGMLATFRRSSARLSVSRVLRTLRCAWWAPGTVRKRRLRLHAFAPARSLKRAFLVNVAS